MNYLAEDEAGEPIAAAYGLNYRRLQEIKRKYDPTNFFHINQNIGQCAEMAPPRLGIDGRSPRGLTSQVTIMHVVHKRGLARQTVHCTLGCVGACVRPAGYRRPSLCPWSRG
ncbi:MAG: BBE domain-containing protein [Alphaproteobacteria bacterium]|nr:BBE domain-containing protein [Alphaproteobacteria bacterium]